MYIFIYNYYALLSFKYNLYDYYKNYLQITQINFFFYLIKRFKIYTSVYYYLIAVKINLIINIVR